MELSLPLLAGIAGTAVMTIFTATGFHLMSLPYNVVRILGNMIPLQQQTPLASRPSLPWHALATVIHYGIGVMFAMLYEAMVFEKILRLVVVDAVLYGMSVGTVGIVGWLIFFSVHPGPPPVVLKRYLPMIWVGHILLGVVLVVVYRQYAAIPAQASIPVCSG